MRCRCESGPLEKTMAQKTTPLTTRLGSFYMWDLSVTPKMIPFYNFIQQVLYELTRVLFYQFNFILFNYNIKLFKENNISIIFNYFFKTKKRKNYSQIAILNKNQIALCNANNLSSSLFNDNLFIQTVLLKFSYYSPKIIHTVASNDFNKIYNAIFSLNLKNKSKRKLIKISVCQKIKKPIVKPIKRLLSQLFFNKYFIYLLKYNFLYCLEKLFFKLPHINFFLFFKNIKEYFTTHPNLKKNMYEIAYKALPKYKYKKQSFYFSLLMYYSIITHNIVFITEQLEKFLRLVSGKRHFVSEFLNILEYFIAKKTLLSYNILLRGTVEKHGRTITFFLMRGKLSLQTFINVIYYSYVQCYQRYGVFGIHLWVRYNSFLQ